MIPQRLRLNYFIVIVSMMLLAACESSFQSIPQLSQKPPVNVDSGPQDGKVRAALLLPLSNNSAANIAKSMENAAQMAVFERGNANFVLIPKDTQGNPATAAAVAEEAVRQGARIFIGPLNSTDVAAVVPIAEKHNIPMYSFSNNTMVNNPGVILMGLTPEQETEAILRYAASRGLQQIAILAPKTTYGDATVHTAEKVASTLNIQIVKVVRYQPTIDIPVSVKEIQAIPCDALFIPDGGDSLAGILSYIHQDGYKAQLLGTRLWDNAKVLQIPSSQGAWFVNFNEQGWGKFSTSYANNFGLPPKRLASLAYDTVTYVIQKHAGDKSNLSSLLRGVDGPMIVQQNGLVNRPLMIYEITQDGKKPLTSFSQ